VNDSARAAVRAQYLEALARTHAIPTTEFAAIGMPVQSTPDEIALSLYAPCEKIYRDRMSGRPSALMDFIWRTTGRYFRDGGSLSSSVGTNTERP
jgi:hypothetical protein